MAEQKRDNKPIIFLAFAKQDTAVDKDDLRHLPDEIHGIRDALKAAETKGLCKVIEKTYVTAKIIFDVFQENKNRIAVFHFGGHANSFQLLLQDSPAHKEGLVPFLAGQKGLTFVFLNGCSTGRQIRELAEAGIPAVVGTYADISDKVATDLSIRFYKGITEGLSLEEAWNDAVDYAKTVKDEDSSEGFRRANYTGKREPGEFPWVIEYKEEGREEIKKWNLPDTAKDSLFGLPPIPKSIGYPQKPYRYLERYEREHAKIFFGRSFFIRELYDKITAEDQRPVILLYGQSGVGKSSLLEAGLFPRLEEFHHVIYTRRTREKGLSRTLEEAIDSQLGHDTDRNSSSLEEKWKRIESQTHKPLVVLLDQVEEVFTDSNKDLPHELDDFTALLKTIFNNREFYPKGKLILGYRKEFHAEIEDKFNKEALEYTWLFLKPLNRDDIIEVVNGLTLTTALKGNYNLEVDDLLPGIIADDLLEDKTTPVAPVLQFIMSKMWEMAKDEDSGTLKFTTKRYQELRKNGIAMKTFFDKQMEELEKRNKDVVDSGLALDVLKFHTTNMGTACFWGIEELRKNYKNRLDILEELIKMEKKFYLLTDAPAREKQEKREGTSLAHDTLAPVVINEYNESDKPGQRASRILAGKIDAFKKNRDEVRLDEADLKIVEQGRDGMKSLNDDEKKLLEISRELKARLDKEKKRNRIIRNVSIVLLFIVAIFAVIQWVESVKNYKKAEANRLDKEASELVAEANRLALVAEAKVTEDPNIALRIAEKAWRLDKNKTVNETIYKIYRENNFYKIIATHQGLVCAAAFSPDGKNILTGSWDKTARLWNLTGKEIRVFNKHKNYVTSVAFSPDGQKILTGSLDKTARLWNLQGNPVHEFKGHEDEVLSVAFSPDGKTILTGSRDKTARLWDLHGKLLKKFDGHTDTVSSVAFSLPNGKTILTGSWDKTARLWDLTGKEIRVFNRHKNYVTSVAFSPDGQKILTGSLDKTARLWNLQGNILQVFKGLEDEVRSVAFSPDGTTILTGSFKTVRLWNLQGNMLQEFKREKYEALSVAFSSDGKTILTASGDNTARLWDLHGNPIQEFKKHGKAVLSVAFSRDGETILTGSRDKTARLWDLKGNLIKEYKVHKDTESPVTSVAFSPDGETILTGSRDKTARLWDLKGNLIEKFKVHKDKESPVRSVAFSPDGKTIITNSLKTARLWDLNGDLRQEIKVHKDTKSFVTSVAMSPDGKTILTGTEDKTARLWDLEGNLLQEFKGHDKDVWSVAFSPDGKTILTGSYKIARLWDLEGNCVWEFKGYTSKVYSVAFSPDGKTILTGSDDKTARLWRVPKTLKDFLEKGNFEKLTQEQKQEYGIRN